MTREELDAVRNHVSNLPIVGAMYAPVLVEWADVLLRQRSEARAALHRIAVLMQCEPDDDDDLAEAVRLLVSERDKARAERRQLRARLVECLPWVGVSPRMLTGRYQSMRLVRDLAEDTLEEVKP